MAVTVRVFAREVYGSKRIYPDNDVARTLVKLTGRKTFTDADLGVLVELGYLIESVADPEAPEVPEAQP